MKLSKYNADWSVDHEIEIEMIAIRKGGQWKGLKGQDCGEGLMFHWQEYWKRLWGEAVVFHRWNLLLLEKFIGTKILMVFGPQDSGKTNTATLWALSNYYLHPKTTAILISSIDLKGLRLRIWAEIVKYHTIAKKRHPTLPGNFIESETMLTTDSRGTARDFRRGVCGIPCYVNGKFVGTQKYAGIKQERMIQIGDEMQAMSNAIVDGISGFMNRPGYQFIGLANPQETTGPEGRLGEPADIDGGWSGLAEPTATTSWKTRFSNGLCINLVGTDSPNFDVPGVEPYSFLIRKKTLEEVAEYWGKDSIQYYSKCIGVMKAGMEGRRVITRALCVKHQALEEPVWAAGKIIKLFSLDAAYGSVGGDRCVGDEMWFGETVDGKMTLAYVKGPLLIPVSIRNVGMLPEEQISTWVMNYCNERAIDPAHVFFDSTGRGSLVSAFARLWSAAVVGVEFGGKATNRPVMENLFVTEYGNKRKKRCDEHYANFVTELWYSWRHVIEAGQFRGLPTDVMAEGCMREWKTVGSGRYQLENKEDTKERIGRSPDLADACVVGVEGARRLGFDIARFSSKSGKADRKWLDDLLKRQNAEKERGRLQYA